MIMKSVVPVVMAGIIAIYGVVVAVLISQDIKGGTQAVADANAKRTHPKRLHSLRSWF